MSLLFDSVVRRHMKPSNAFLLPGQGESLPAVPLSGDEVIIGYYRNPPPWEQSFIVFTSSAIWTVEGARSHRIALTEIVGYEGPKSKEGTTGLRLRTEGGFHFVRIAGAHGPNGKYKDFIALEMIIRAVVMATRRSGSWS